MSFEPIRQLDIENYGCIKKASFALTPLHALIGPNDSGKSTTLQALRMAVRYAMRDFASEPNVKLDPKVGASPNDSSIKVGYSDGLAYGIRLSQREFPIVLDSAFLNGIAIANGNRDGRHPGVLDGIVIPGKLHERESLAVLKARISKATLVRFDPDYLRAPAQLIPESQGISFADERGTGLASVFDAIVNRDPEAFARIQSQVRILFPSVAKVGLINVSNSQKEIAISLADGTRVGAEGMSEGLLYYLGFAALQYIEGARVFLVEEPENGLHPARIGEVMDTLREISKTSQVIIATHSPLVVNELEGHEVSVVTRDPALGTRTILLKDVPDFADASKVYRPGEFWVSYCDGNQEAPLLSEEPRS
jgi:energy-coupling factor transporter ATP-binding protein EcfA2